jgi:hypothetical protein
VILKTFGAIIYSKAGETTGNTLVDRLLQLSLVKKAHGPGIIRIAAITITG